MNKIKLLVLFLFIAIESWSQQMDNLHLGVTDYRDTSSGELLKQLKSADADSNKVKLLLRICGFYWHGTKSDDSILYYSKEALKLAQALHYNPGYYEACFLQCKINAKKGNVVEAKTYLPMVPKDQQARLLLVLGEYYMFLPGEQKNNLDSAYPYLKSALALSEAIQNLHWKEESLLALGKYYFAAGDFFNGKESFMKVIRYYQEVGDKKNEANRWYSLGLYMPDTDSTFRDEVNAYEKALQLYYEVKDTAEVAEVLYDFSAVYRYHYMYDSSKHLLSTAISLLNSTQTKRFYKFYLQMSNVCQLMGDLDDALFYALETIKNMEVTGETNNMSLVQYLLGDIYAALNQHENSLKYFLSAKEKIIARKLYMTYSKAADQFLQLQRPREALKLLLDFEKKAPPVQLADKEIMAGTKADCYFALGEYNTAEKYYLQMISLDVLVQKNRKKVVFPTESISGPEAYYKIGKFYVEQKKYTVASAYLARALETNSFEDGESYSTDLLRNIKWMQFKADSATGNYFSALQNFQKYTAINDSIFNTDRIRQAEKMRMTFETEEKEKNILLLQKETKIQQGNLQQATMTKNVAIAGIALLLIIVGLLFSRYKLKQRSNTEITRKNSMLQHLLNEKEWLLKEVHHRVKNNLHTVICLLESQAAYLQDDALKAIENSQHRIFAMSLIHQKLYQSEDVKAIDMSVYLPEFIQYLEDSFNSSKQIHFQLDIHPLNLSLSQAIPVALIINEAVTNSIKYAFPENRKGVIKIIMQQLAEKITLIIADNGIGIAPALTSAPSDSLGLKLIAGLSEDIGAKMRIENNRGAWIIVEFDVDALQEQPAILSKPIEVQQTIEKEILL